MEGRKTSMRYHSQKRPLSRLDGHGDSLIFGRNPIALQHTRTRDGNKHA